MLKPIAVAVVATLVCGLVVYADDEAQQWPPVEETRRDTASMLTKLREAVKQIEFLAEEVDAALRVSDMEDDHGWLPANIEMYKRNGRRLQSGRRRYDNYGVAGRFGRSAN